MASSKYNPQRRSLLKNSLIAAAAASVGVNRLVFAATPNVATTRAGGKVTPDAIKMLADKLPGAVVSAGESGYEKSRLTWNGTVEQHPAVIVQARSAGDIKVAVEFAREHNLGVAVKATGHGALVPANNDALLIDTSRMKGLRVDPQAKTATFEPGVVAIEFLREAQKYGLAGPTAVSPGVGMTGYTLSGGYGDLPRVFGLGSDNLLSADVLLMDGRHITVSENENPDIFWAMRGGGGNFAIVTSMTVKLHPVSDVLSGVLTFDIDDAHKVVGALREWSKTLPDNMTMALSFFAKNVTKTPRPIITLALVYFGPETEGQPVIDKLLASLKPQNNTIKAQSYLSYFENDVQDPGYGFKNYWHGVLIDELTDPVVDILVKTVSPQDSMMMLLFSYYRGGVWSRSAENKTAVSHRNASWLLNGRAFFKGDEQVVAIAKKQVATLAQDLAPYNKGVPFTYLEYEGPSRLEDVYGAQKLDKMREIKAKYDPDNRLRFNANIPPAKTA